MERVWSLPSSVQAETHWSESLVWNALLDVTFLVISRQCSPPGGGEGLKVTMGALSAHCLVGPRGVLFLICSWFGPVMCLGTMVHSGALKG